MKCRIGFMSNDICQPLFVYQALPRKAVPTTPVEPAAPSNEDTPPGAGLDADPQKTCQTVKAHAAHPAGVSTSASPTRALALQACSRMGFMALIHMKCIGRPYRGQVRQASWYKFPVPCLGQDQASHHLHRRSARPCHRKWYPAVETGFDMQCIDARYDTVPASMVVRAAPHWRPPSTCTPPNITDAHTTTTGIKASRLLTPLYQTKARTARRHSSTNTARRMARSPFILTWAKQVYITQNTRYFSRQQDMMKSIICITDSLFLWQSRLLPVIGSLRAQPWQSKANTGMMLPQ